MTFENVLLFFYRFLPFFIMQRLTIVCLVIVAGLCFGLGRGGYAQTWAEELFTEKKHDFGKVAIGADVSHVFRFQNVYKEDIHIASVASNCNCTLPTIVRNHVKTGEFGEIRTKFNTSGQFTKEKGATVTVVFDKPFDAEVQLQVSGYIRPDVIITPGTCEFGTVRTGKSTTKTVLLEYAGNPNWGLIAIEQNNRYVSATAVETIRKKGEVQYEITVTLEAGAPSGYIKDSLRLVTNELQRETGGKEEYSSVLLPIHAAVAEPLSVKPSPFPFGVIGQHETVTKNLILHGVSTFRVLSATSEDPRLVCTFSDSAGKIHIIPVTLRTETAQTEPMDTTILLKTDLPDMEYVRVPVVGHLFAKETDLIPQRPPLDNAPPPEILVARSPSTSNNIASTASTTAPSTTTITTTTPPSLPLSPSSSLSPSGTGGTEIPSLKIVKIPPPQSAVFVKPIMAVPPSSK